MKAKHAHNEYEHCLQPSHRFTDLCIWLFRSALEDRLLKLCFYTAVIVASLALLIIGILFIVYHTNSVGGSDGDTEEPCYTKVSGSGPAAFQSPFVVYFLSKFNLNSDLDSCSSLQKKWCIR